MTSSPSLFDEKWDVALTLDWLQALVLGRGSRLRKEEEQQQQQQQQQQQREGGASPPPPPSNVVVDKRSTSRNQRIHRVVLQFPDALLPVSLEVQARLSAGSNARGFDLEVRE